MQDAGNLNLDVKAAADGDEESLSRLVAHFSPMLLSHARWLLGPRMARFCDPEDLVSESWAITFPRLEALSFGDRPLAVLGKFLGTTLVQLVNGLIRKHLVRRGEGAAVPSTFSRLPDSTRGVISSVMRRERASLLAKTLEEMDEIDRAVLMLIGLEQRSRREVAGLLSMTEDAVKSHLERAKVRLRSRLPESLFDTLVPPEPAP